MRSSKPYKPLGKPVDSRWMTEMTHCFDPVINLDQLQDHLCLRDCEEIVKTKSECSDRALIYVQKSLAPQSAHMGKTDIRKDKNSRFYDPSSESEYDSEEDMNTLPSFSAKYVTRSQNTELCSETLDKSLVAFSKALPFCYPLTYHLMCKDWADKYPSTLICYCPLCPAMNGWRKQHNLVIDNSYLCYLNNTSTKNQKKSAKALKDHISLFSSNRNKPFHRLVLEYLVQCQGSLPYRVRCYIADNKHIKFFNKRPIIRDTDIPSRSASVKKDNILSKVTAKRSTRTSVTDKDVTEDSTANKVPTVIDVISDSEDNNSRELKPRSSVSKITDCHTSAALSSCSSTTVSNKRPRNYQSANAYDKYKRRNHTKPTFNQYGSGRHDNAQSTESSVNMNNNNCMFVLGDGKMINSTEKRIGKAEKPPPVHHREKMLGKAENPPSVRHTSSSSQSRRKESVSTSPVRVKETVVLKPSSTATVDLNDASAAQLMSALNRKGYKSIDDLFNLAETDIDASIFHDDHTNTSVINSLGKKNTYHARDAVKNNILSGKQNSHEDGHKSEIVSIMTMSFGPQPIKVFSNDRRTDAQLQVQAKKNYKWKLRKKGKAKEKKDSIATNDSGIDNNSSKTSYNYIVSDCNLDLPSVDIGITNHTSDKSPVSDPPIVHTTLDVPLDVTIDNLNVVDVTGSSNQLTCMLIGLCFNRDIISGLHKDDINGIIHLSDNKGKYYNDTQEYTKRTIHQYIIKVIQN